MDALSSQWFRNWGIVGAHVSRSVAVQVGPKRPWGGAVERAPSLGQLVISRAGRDCGRPMVVVRADGARFVWVSDGDLRPVARAKRKNVRHVEPRRAVWEMVAAGRVPADAELRGWLASMMDLEGSAGTEPGGDEGEVDA